MMLRATLDTHERLETLLGALGTRVDQAAQRQQAVGQDVHAQTRELVLLGNGLLDQLTRQTEQLQLRFGEVGSRHPTLEKTVDTHQGTIGEINQTMKGVLDRIDRQIEFGERRRTETGSEQEALRTSLEQNRESALQLTQILEALPVRMQTAELVQSQTQLASTMGRLLGGLERDLQAQQGGQPA
jgi:chromosome segregation ATPase